MTRLVFPYIDGKPIVPIDVGFGGIRARAYQAQHRQLPPLRRLLFLADTGASNSAIDELTAAHLGLRSVGSGPVNSATSGGAPVMCADYEIGLQIMDPATGVVAYTEWRLIVPSSDFRGQQIAGLLGRDVLDKMVALFHGPKQSLILDI